MGPLEIVLYVLAFQFPATAIFLLGMKDGEAFAGWLRSRAAGRAKVVAKP